MRFLATFKCKDGRTEYKEMNPWHNVDMEEFSFIYDFFLWK